MLFGLVLGSLGIGNHELWRHDEPRVAGVGKEMWDTGSWATPRLQGQAFVEKPPLYWWTQIGLYEVFGTANAGLARSASALFGLGTLALTFLLGRRFFPPESALLGGLALLTTYFFVLNSHWIVVDNALLFSTTGVLASFAAAMDSAGRARAGWLAAFYAFLAAAFFSKGVIGVGIPSVGIGAWLLWSRRLREFLGLHLIVGGAALLGLAALWLWRLGTDAGSEAVRAFVLMHQLGRFVPGMVDFDGGHREGFFYYFRQTPVDLMPWFPVLVLAGYAAWRGWSTLAARERDGIAFCAFSALLPLLVLSLSGTKRSVYLLPVVAPTSLIVGWWMGSGRERDAFETPLIRIMRPLLLVVAGVLPALCVGIDLHWWPVAVAGMLVYGLSAHIVLRLPVRSEREDWLRVLALVCLGFALLYVSALRAWDPVRSFRPLLEQVNGLVAAEDPLYRYRTGENTNGLVSFYTGRQSESIGSLGELRERLAAEGGFWILVEGKEKRGDVEGAIVEVQQSELPQHVSAVVEADGRFLYLVRVGTDDAG